MDIEEILTLLGIGITPIVAAATYLYCKKRKPKSDYEKVEAEECNLTSRIDQRIARRIGQIEAAKSKKLIEISYEVIK